MNLVINFERIKWCFNNIIKVLCMAKSHTLKSFIIIKTPFYPLKINKKRNKKYLCNALLLAYVF